MLLRSDERWSARAEILYMILCLNYNRSSTSYYTYNWGSGKKGILYHDTDSMLHSTFTIESPACHLLPLHLSYFPFSDPLSSPPSPHPPPLLIDLSYTPTVHTPFPYPTIISPPSHFPPFHISPSHISPYLHLSLFLYPHIISLPISPPFLYAPGSYPLSHISLLLYPHTCSLVQ